MANRQTFSISFYCRPSKVDKKGLAPIELSLVINGQRTYLKLQRKERPDDFKRAVESKRNNEIKNYCDSQRVLINRIVQEMQYADIELSAENLKDCLKKGGVLNEYSLGELWKDAIYTRQNDVKEGGNEVETFKRYTLSKNAFYNATGFDDATAAKKVELQHIHVFQKHLRNDMNLAQNTAYLYHARTKAAFTLAFNRGKIKANPYAAFKMDKGESEDKVFLSEEELNIIKGKQMVERLNRVRDLFVFQCYSGLSYSDMAMLSKSDYQKNDKGQIFIQKHRKKTNKLFKSIVLKDGVSILEKYDYQLPIISNVKYNAYLKEIQTLCNISKSLHTHLGRTTYICYLYNKRVPIDTIAEIVGHSSCHTTLKYYAKMDNSTIFETLRELNVAESIPKEKGERLKSDNDEERKKRRKEAQQKKSEAIADMLKTTGIDTD